jgi:uncharacterized membrane protein YbhN (UPF0104 family)
LSKLSAKQRAAFKIALTLLTVLLLYFTLRGRQDLSKEAILEAVRRFRPWNALAVILLGMAQILFMIVRMFVLCPTRPRVPFREVTFAVAVGHAVNMFFPARAGEALKILWLGRAGGNDPGYLARGAGWLLADRLLDLGGLIVLVFTSGVLGLPAFRQVVPFSLWWIPIAIAGFLALIGLFSVVSARVHRKLQTWTQQLSQGLSGVLKPGPAIIALLMGVASWAVEISAIGVLAWSQGYPLSIAQIFFVLVVLNLAIAIPISVANVGTFEAAVAFALKFFDVPIATSIAIAGAHHLLQLFGVAGWALAALAWRRGKSPTPVTSTESGPST